MKKLLVFVLILSCLGLFSCEKLPWNTNETTRSPSEDSATESMRETTEETTAETEPPRGYTTEDPTPLGEAVQIPAAKATLTMKVLEILGDAENIIVKMNLTVENMQTNSRLDLSMANFELICKNGLILDQEYDYYDEYYGIAEEYNLDLPNVSAITMGTDGSVDFYVHFRGNIDHCSLLSATYATNKYLYFALS